VLDVDPDHGTRPKCQISPIIDVGTDSAPEAGTKPAREGVVGVISRARDILPLTKKCSGMELVHLERF
jgi:hypothetical protein